MKYIPPEKLYYKRRGETLSIKQAFSKVIEKSDFGRQYYRKLVLNAWKEIMGETVAKRTSRIFLKQKALFVELNSAPLRQELKLIQSEIIPRINQQVGKEMIEEIIFL